jgi:hypothetical protein
VGCLAGLVSRAVGFAIDFLRIASRFKARTPAQGKNQSSGTSGSTKSRHKASIPLDAIALARFRERDNSARRNNVTVTIEAD